VNPLWSNIFRKKHDEESLAFFLGSVPVFSEMNARELSYLESRVHSRTYDSNESVFSEGDPGSGIYMIRSGQVKIFSHDTKGREVLYSTLGPGDFFGETTLAAPAMRSASARTVEKSVLIGLFRADLLDTVQKHPVLANKILIGLTRVMSERLQAAGDEIRRLEKHVAETPATEATSRT
jgi:CRP/FNR family transcriptional regulator, cyclic AMP receptor protein